MLLRLVFAAVIATLGIASAAPRTWKSADGNQSFEGEFISRQGTQITLQPTGGKRLTVALTKLHPDDQKWINLHHPVEATGIFGDLNFGDSREAVRAKLKKSELLEPQPEVEANVFGNEVIERELRLRQKIGDLPATLRLGWSDDDKLQEITIQTDPLAETAYNDRLQRCWKELVDLLTGIQGQPSHSSPFPARGGMPDGGIRGSHLWKLEPRGSAMLGTARIGNSYLVIVTFSEKSAGQQ